MLVSKPILATSTLLFLSLATSHALEADSTSTLQERMYFVSGSQFKKKAKFNSLDLIAIEMAEGRDIMTIYFGEVEAFFL